MQPIVLGPEASRRAGIGVDRHLIKVYAISGLMSGVAGVLSLAFYGTTTLAGHPTDNLTVITAVVLGGASLFGGRGSMFGTFIGVFIPALLLNGLVILSVNQGSGRLPGRCSRRSGSGRSARSLAGAAERLGAASRVPEDRRTRASVVAGWQLAETPS